ncbi:MAG: ribonuclease P protein component [Dysgonomonas sp.]
MERAIKHTFGKEEKLCGKISIDKLFLSGKSFICYPLRIVFLEREREKDNDASVLVSVSKKKFKRAVKRNRMKRLIREAYRLNKTGFVNICSQHNTGLDIAFLYLKDELTNYQEIEESMLKAITVLNEKLQKNENHK